MRDVMIDLETLGTEPGCVILSIGATDGANHFEVHIDVEDSYKQGLAIEPRTVMWWMDQDKQARKLITEPGTPLESALTLFVNAFDWKDCRVWCNGAAFDFPILKAAMSKVGMKLPWAYYNEMDFRTLKNLVTKETYKSLEIKADIKHDGLEDAKAQWKTLSNLLNYLEQNHVNLKRAA